MRQGPPGALGGQCRRPWGAQCLSLAPQGECMSELALQISEQGGVDIGRAFLHPSWETGEQRRMGVASVQCYQRCLVLPAQEGARVTARMSKAARVPPLLPAARTFGADADRAQSPVPSPPGSPVIAGSLRKHLARLTLIPSILNPSVAVELMVSLHCMYRGLVTARWAFSSSVGASGSTSIIFWYMSLRRLGFLRALVSSSSR